MFIYSPSFLRAVRLGTLAAAVLGGSILVACGDSDEPEPEAAAVADPEAEAHPTVDPNATPTPDPGPAASSLKVDLTEWSVAPSKNSVPAGVIQFIADNTGGDTHELVILRNGEELTEVEGLRSGHVQAMRIRLDPGEYELACLIVETEPDGTKEDHYQLGMHTKFEVE